MDKINELRIINMYKFILFSLVIYELETAML